MRRVTILAAAVLTLGGATVWPSAQVAMAAPPQPVFTADVNPVSESSDARELTVVGNRLFFVAYTEHRGRDLYVVEGAGAPMRIDINPTVGSYPTNLTVVDGQLWFSASDGTHGAEVWRSDGTVAGTEMVADIDAGAGSSDPADFVAFAGQLYFTADDGVHGRELWRTSGTGATLVADVLDGPGGSSPYELTVVEYGGPPATSVLWFGAWTGTGFGSELVSVDDVGTVSVALLDRSPVDLVVIGETLYSLALPSPAPPPPIEPVGEPAPERALHRTAKTGASFTTTSLGGVAADLTVFGGQLYFSNTTPGSGAELATWDGAAITTVKDIVPGAAGSSPFAFTEAGGVLYFVATAAGQQGLWRTDGTGSNTTLVVELGQTAFDLTPPALAAGPSGELLFAAATTATGREPYRYTGTGAPTLIDDIAPGAAGSAPVSFTVAGAHVFLVADHPVAGREVLRWSAPYGADTVEVVADLRPITGSSSPGTAFEVGDHVVWSASDPVGGGELFAYDTATGSTALWTDIDPVGGLSGFLPLGSLGSALLFEAGVGFDDTELWRADGSDAGTVPVADIDPDADDAIQDMVVWNGVAYFSASDGVEGRELWRSDGTTSGTYQLASFIPGFFGGAPTNFTPMGDHLYFSVFQVSGTELWRTDGTVSGTTRVVAGTSQPQGVGELVAMQDRLYFSARDPASPTSFAPPILWSSDGTSVGTAPVPSPANATAGFPNRLTPSGDRLFFEATSQFAGPSGVWVVDRSGGPSRSLTPAGVDTQGAIAATQAGVVFAADDPEHGIELWASDGTVAGTGLLRDFVAGASSGQPMSLTAMYGFVYFAARTTAEGNELWRTDGTGPGTQRLSDLRPGVHDGIELSTQFTVARDRVWFAGTDEVHGKEMWFVADPPTLPAAPAAPSAAAGVISATVSWSGVADVPDAPVTGYTVTASPGGARCSTTGALTCTVSGLAANASYTFTVRASSRFGSGPPSASSNAVVPTAPVVPGAPASPTATVGQLSATVAWQAVANPAGAPVTGYTVTASPGGASCSTSGALSCSVGGLVAGSSYTFTVVATNVAGSSAASPSSNAVVPTAPAVVTLSPARVLETRVGEDLDTVDGLFQGVGRQAAGSTLELTVAGRAGVPGDAGAVMVNVTAVAPDTAGFVTVFPCGEDRPNASSVNYAAGQVVPNAVLAKIGSSGRICLFTKSASDLLVDVNGYVPAGGSPATVSPARLLETRSGPDLLTVDGQFQGIGRQAAGGVVELVVAGRGNVPSNASAVMLNVTAVAPDGPGFLTVYPCGQDRPNASSVNYQAGQVVPNAVLAQVGANGAVCVYTTSAAHLLVDVNGFVPAGSAPTPVVPARLLETRSGPNLLTVDGQFQGIGRQPAGTVVELLVAGRGNVPSNASAVMVNVTAVGPGSAGFLTVFPCGQTQPGASSVNYQAGQVVPNAVLAKIGAGGKICIFTLADADLLVDVTGWT